MLTWPCRGQEAKRDGPYYNRVPSAGRQCPLGRLLPVLLQQAGLWAALLLILSTLLLCAAT